MMLVRTTRREGGMAVVIVLVLLVIMFALAMAGTRSLAQLKSELSLIERDQTNRLATASRPRSP